MAQTAAKQLDLFTDPNESGRVLPGSGWPFWTLNVMDGGRLHQQTYRLHQLEFVLSHIRKDRDSYMSQGFFAQPSRRAMHVAWMTHAYVDLDLYKMPWTAGHRIDALVYFVLETCDELCIPRPSYVVFSGRGLYLKWAWSSPIPRAAAGRLVAVNRALVRAFSEYGADPAAVDVSRILRVVGTVNSKSGQVAEVVWQNEVDGQIVTYGFEQFADQVLPYTLAEIRQFREDAATRRGELRILSQERAKRRAAIEAEQARRGNQRSFAPEDWHWGVLEDVRWLAENRFPGGIVEPGHLDTFGFLGACQLARVIPAPQLWHEVQAWGRIILPANYVNGPYRRHCSTLLRLAQEDMQREPGEQAKAYRYRKSRLIDMLKITGDEMAHMTRLIDDGEKRRRDREHTMAQRRADGMVPRDEYLAAAHGMDDRVLLLAHAHAYSVREIAAETGLSKSKVARILAAHSAPDAAE